MENSLDQLIRRKEAVVKAAQNELDGIIAGSFFKRVMNGRERYCLSRMQNKKQRQVYISGQHAQAVKDAVEKYDVLTELIRELSELNLALIKQGVEPGSE